MAKLAINGGTPVRSEPFPAWPPYGAEEKRQLLEVLESRNWGGYPSPNVKAAAFARAFAAAHDAAHGICAVNGTVTLKIALRAAGLKAGDEVIVPALTWMATAFAPADINCVPVFADVCPDTYCLDPACVEALIGPRTRAVIPVHLGGTIADLDALKAICEKHDLILVEDCAHMHGGKWRGQGVGSHGHFGSFSFQTSKLMTAGEGGIVLTNDKVFEERCQSLVNCGRKEYGYDSFPGSVIGWNYRISEFQAAILLAQLDTLGEYTARREANASYLEEQLAGIEGVTLLRRDERITTRAVYEFIWKFDPAGWKGVHRDTVLNALMHEGVNLDGDFYVPVHQVPLFELTADWYPMIRERYGETVRGADIHVPVAARAGYHEAVWMHCRHLMGTRSEVDDVVEAIRKVHANIDELVGVDDRKKGRFS